MALPSDIPAVLALIPARGGSKSLPRKNILPLQGKPLIAHTIEDALQSKRIQRVIVTTDSEEIANIAREYGAEVPFLRPAELAGDASVDIEYLRHALEWLAENENYHPALIATLRPTEPIRQPATIDRAIETLIDHPGADALRSVRLATETPFKMWLREPSGLLQPAAPLAGVHEPHNQPRQCLPLAYWQDGYIDVARAETILKKNSPTGARILGFIIDEETINIDYADELAAAERTLDEAAAAKPKRDLRHPS
jgi:N-acylneuraminate cytidylyltransferase